MYISLSIYIYIYIYIYLLVWNTHTATDGFRHHLVLTPEEKQRTYIRMYNNNNT